MAPSTRRIARGAALLAGVAGGYGVLRLLGAFGPVSCWTSQSASSSGETVTTSGCEAGIDYLFGSTGGNAPVLFFWAVVLAGLVGVGVAAAWTGRRHLTWAVGGGGVAVSILGAMSVGFYFALPTLWLLVAATAESVAARRGRDDASLGV